MFSNPFPRGSLLLTSDRRQSYRPQALGIFLHLKYTLFTAASNTIPLVGCDNQSGSLLVEVEVQAKVTSNQLG